MTPDTLGRAGGREWAQGCGTGRRYLVSTFRSFLHSLCLCSDGSYGVEKGLISSFPTRNIGGQLDIVQGLQLNAFSQGKLDATVNELKEERDMVKDLLSN